MKRKNMVHSRAPRWSWLIACALAIVILPGSGPSAASEQNDELAGPRVAQNTPPAAQGASREKRPPTILSYGDGKADGKKSYGGNGHMIRFELPEGVTKVRGIRIHGSRYGVPQAPNEDIEITFLSEDREEILDSQGAPYRLFKRGKEAWVRILFGAIAAGIYIAAAKTVLGAQNWRLAILFVVVAIINSLLLVSGSSA